MRRKISRQAHRDVDELADFIAADNLDAAIRFTVATYDTFAFIAETPGAGSTFYSKHPRFRGIRKWAVRGFKNYLILYSVHADHIAIYRVIHAARDRLKISLTGE